jgi:hypothetical protein
VILGTTPSGSSGLGEAGRGHRNLAFQRAIGRIGEEGRFAFSPATLPSEKSSCKASLGVSRRALWPGAPGTPQKVVLAEISEAAPGAPSNRRGEAVVAWIDTNVDHCGVARRKRPNQATTSPPSGPFLVARLAASSAARNLRRQESRRGESTSLSRPGSNVRPPPACRAAGGACAYAPSRNGPASVA